MAKKTASPADNDDRSKLERRRSADSDRKSESLAAAKTLIIPPCEDRERRELLESDDEEWLLWYFGDECGVSDPFTYRFVDQQRDMIAAIGYALRNGDDQAIAASRGEGKTTIAERLVLKYVASGQCNYAVLFGSTGPMAENILDAINTYIIDNDRFADDYPEISVPVRELQGAPQRARTQRATGHRHDNGEPYEMAELAYSWCGNELIFPNVPGSPSAKAIIATRGLDAAVRGLKKRGKRPQLAIIDDPDTEDTARSEEQAAKLLKRIDAAIGGLGGQRRSVGRVVLTTLQSRIAASYVLTDPKQRQTFKGRRYRWLIKPPDRADLWEEYVAMRLDDLQQRDAAGNDTDPQARRSHAFYAERRAEMDAGAVVSNPNRYDPSTLPDGTQRELSALQAYYNLVAKLGPEVVATEYDNDPPEESAIVESGLAPTAIQRKLSGFARRTFPRDCTVITVGADVRKTAIHWAARAWTEAGAYYTIDYGVHEVRGTTYGSDEGVDEAIRKAVLEFADELRGYDFADDQGEVRAVDLTLVDAGWKTDSIYAACHEIGTGIMPVMGFGRSSGCTQANFSEAQHRTRDKKPGDRWFLSKKGRLWLVCADADYWKGWEHDRWLTGPDKPGSMLLFGELASAGNERLTDDEKQHHSYARHITNEREVEEPHKGGLRRVWRARSENTHWLDASYYASVAANIRGIRLQHAAPPKAGEHTTANTAAAPASARQVANATRSAAAGPGLSWFSQQQRRRG